MLEDKLVTTNDGSHTLFSLKYNQHFHNTEDGGFSEALHKHIIPAFSHSYNKKELNILDLDFDLIKSLQNFSYPKEFEKFKNIIDELSNNQKYEDEKIKIELFIGDAREYLKTFPKDFFDIVYQDAFSSEVNKELWTKEYFEDIYKISKEDSILTTYAISTNIRLSMYEARFYIYETRPTKRKITLAFKNKEEKIGKYIDMELKKIRNKDAKALFDSFI